MAVFQIEFVNKRGDRKGNGTMEIENPPHANHSAETIRQLLDTRGLIIQPLMAGTGTIVDDKNAVVGTLTVGEVEGGLSIPQNIIITSVTKSR